MSFTADVSRIAQKMERSAEDVARATIIELFASVVKDTPVLSGRLRGNWQATVNAPTDSQIEIRQEGAVLVEINATVTKPGLYWLTNNLPYAERIEFDGWSHTKAPRGMVRINVRRLKSILRKRSQ